MDATDLGILRAIGIEPFAGLTRDARPWRPEVLAEALGASPRLVKDRVARLERDGFILGYDVQPNLRLLGLAARTYAFEVPPGRDRHARLDALLKLEGVMGFVDYLSGWLTVTLLYGDDREREVRLGLVRAHLGGAEPLTWFDAEMPAPGHIPTALDWRILDALAGDARRSVRETATAVGVSTKTVQRRIDRLAAGRAFATFARLGGRFHEEVLFCALVIQVDEARAREAMQALHGNVLTDAWARCSAPLFQEGTHYDLVAAPRSPREMAGLLDEVAGIPGVLGVQGHVAARMSLSLDWVQAAARKARAAS